MHGTSRWAKKDWHVAKQAGLFIGNFDYVMDDAPIAIDYLESHRPCDFFQEAQSTAARPIIVAWQSGRSASN
jgi:hypothetical protein